MIEMQFVIQQYRRIAALMIILYGLVGWYCANKLSVTGDEANYYTYAARVLKGHPEKEIVNGKPLYNSQMPIVAINTLPRAVSKFFHPGQRHDLAETLRDIRAARLFSIISAMILAVYVFFWAAGLYGPMAGLFSLLLLMVCPNILAHSQMVGTDVYSFLLCTATCYHAWRFSKGCSRWQLVLVSILLGLGQITKQSLILLYPVVLLLLWVRLMNSGLAWKIRAVSWIKQVMLILLVSLLVINIGFRFHETGKKAGDYIFVSASFKNLQHRLSFAANVPVPLPSPYVSGFDYVRFNSESPAGITGLSSYGSATFLGKRITGELLWYYYPVSCLFKMPVATLLIVILSVLFFTSKKGPRRFLQNEIYLLLPFVLVLLFFIFFNNMYLGIRNILFVFPLIYVFCGSLVDEFQSIKPMTGKWVLAGLLCWQIISVANYFPHFLPYTNEFIPDKKNAFKVFSDANIYFEEGYGFAQDFLLHHPEIQWEPVSPVKGKVMVSMESYIDYWNEGKMNWLRNLHLQPVGHVDSQYLIFEVR